MARYMIQASYTKEAAAALVKKPEDRSLAVRPLVEKLGGRLIDFYFGLGDYDVVLIAELLNNAELKYYQKWAPRLVKEPPASTYVQPAILARPEFLVEFDVIAVVKKSG